MNSQRTVDDLLRQAEQDHATYMRSLRAALEASGRGSLASQGGGGPSTAPMERTGSHGSSSSPLIRAITFEPDPPHRSLSVASDILPAHYLPGGRRSRRPTNELPELRRSQLTQSGLGIAKPTHKPASVFSGDTDWGDDDGDFLPLTEPVQPARHHSTDPGDDTTQEAGEESLPHESFTLQQLVDHLKALEDTNEAAAKALDNLWDKRDELDTQNVTEEGDLYTNATYEVFDVDQEGSAVARHQKGGEIEAVEAKTVWQTLKEVNSEGVRGRITILQEPSPMMLGAAHMTMANHFDMDELFRHLVTSEGNRGKTRAYVDRAFETTEMRRRTFFFVFKYYTVVGEGLTPAPWQQFDYRPPDKRSSDHIDISECSSILALSLEGHFYKKSTRKRRNKREEGSVCHPFAPWYLLSIQCFPDNEHSLRSADLNKRFVNGPYAFLDTLAAEYRDAVKRYAQLNELITKLITPPREFMFDSKLRDKLLFEDQDFTYSRRYFWAYNSLGVINDGIKSMRSAYLENFKDDFWAGDHETIWPYPYPEDLQEKSNYQKLMSTVRYDLERAIMDLETMYNKNERTRAEIGSLREQLFSGSSVRESRRAIEQGDNIKILTGVSMLFLPLTFVTSVFGITTFGTPVDDWRFPVTMVLVCVPFFMLIFVLQTRAGMKGVKKCGQFFERHFSGYFNPVGRRQHQLVQQQHQQTGTADDGARKRKKKGGFGLKRSHSGLMMQNGIMGIAADNAEKIKKKTWFPWRRKGPRGDLRDAHHV